LKKVLSTLKNCDFALTPMTPMTGPHKYYIYGVMANRLPMTAYDSLYQKSITFSKYKCD
jgi:hypothetical protein